MKDVLNDLLDQIDSIPNDNEIESSPTITTFNPILLDSTLLNELLTKKLNLHEYLVLLDRLVDNNILQLSSKSAEDLSNEIVSLAEEIEHYRTIINSDLDPNLLHRNFDSQYHQQFLSNTQSNYSVLSFLQQSTSMDMSLLLANEFSNPLQSTLITSTIQQQQQTSTNGGKLADVGQ